MPIRRKCVYVRFHCAGWGAGLRRPLSGLLVLMLTAQVSYAKVGFMLLPILLTVLDAPPQMQLDRVVGMNDRAINGSVWPASRSLAVK